MRSADTGEKFPEKCACLRRMKRNLLAVVFCVALIGGFAGVAIRNGIRNGTGAAVALAAVLAAYVLAVGVLYLVFFAKIWKKCRRCRRAFPVKIDRAAKRVRGRKRYYFEVVCPEGAGSGRTWALYSKKDALRAEELFRKGELRVFYDPEAPEGSGGRFIFPDV